MGSSQYMNKCINMLDNESTKPIKEKLCGTAKINKMAENDSI